MTHRVRGAFGAVVALWLVAAATLAAQQTTGKIEGTVSDQAGVAISNAQVLIVGTSFGALTDNKGYYFFNNVPVGVYTLRAQFIGYAPAELRGIRVLGGQTITADIKMQSSAVVLTGITVEAAANPIVPRDQVSSKSIVGQQLVNNLPIDDVRNVITLQPGVVESGSAAGVAIRGGRPGEANVYIDGAPVRSVNSGGQGIAVGTNAVEEASVTTGALGVEFGDAQSGLISYTTRSGGPTLAGSVSGQTDEPFGDAISVGFNRFEGSIGGPVPRVRNLGFFLSGVLQGQTSRFRGAGWDNVPTYTISGLDTIVNVIDAATGNNTAVFVPRFAQYGGQCDAAANFGLECQGRRFPMDWRGNIQLQGKLSYSYGTASNVSLTGIATGDQGRNWPSTNIANSQLFTGFHSWSRAAILNLNHSVFKTAERQLALNVNLSYATNDSIFGPLTAADEISTRDPAGGIELGVLDFNGFQSFPFPINDQIIRNVRTNTGLRTPFLDRTELRNTQPYRMNPFGLLSGSWITSGFDRTGTLYAEKRYTGRFQVDWQANRYHRFNVGAEGRQTNLAYWNSGFITQFQMDAYKVKPWTYAAWAADRLDLGDVVLELGVRYDAMNAKALFAKTPGRIFTNNQKLCVSGSGYVPAPSSGVCPAGTTGPFAAWSNAAATNDAAYDSSLARVFTPSETHSTLSPRLRVSFPITEKTDFRLSYSHQVQTPELNTVLRGVNNDLSFTNTNDRFGRDVGFGKTILFEFGVRHAFSADLVLDVSAYNKSFTSDLAYRIVPFDDPANPGRTQNVNILTTRDFGYARGIDAKLDRRIGSWLNASVSYTLQVARNTGSDPYSYLRTSSRQISQVTGDRVPPPEQPLPIDDERGHNIVGAVSLTVPTDWRKGTMLGSALNDLSVFGTFRVVSGLPYTRIRNSGSGATAPRTNFGNISNQVEPINSSTLPWQKFVDLRFNKGMRLGRTDITVFADIRNLFNFKNITQLYAETDDVVNALFQQTTISPEFANLAIEANQQGKLLAGGAIDLRPSCAGWTGAAGPVNCVMLRRTEARFGNGDQVYSLDEQTRALNAYYSLFNGPQNFYGQPRHIRIGAELNF